MNNNPGKDPRIDRTSRLVRASPEAVYRAFIDPALLVRWLPPKGARATLDRFEPRPGGAFEMTLTFQDPAAGGKTGAGTDVVRGSFVELVPSRRIAQLFTFKSDDPAFAGTMRMSWTLEPSLDGTRVTVTAENVPPGIRPQDHEAGMASSLSNLAELCEGG
jgi:uncharacterized protein YndB with AHSA1/START domain